MVLIAKKRGRRRRKSSRWATPGAVARFQVGLEGAVGFEEATRGAGGGGGGTQGARLSCRPPLGQAHPLDGGAFALIQGGPAQSQG